MTKIQIIKIIPLYGVHYKLCLFIMNYRYYIVNVNPEHQVFATSRSNKLYFHNGNYQDPIWGEIDRSVKEFINDMGS